MIAYRSFKHARDPEEKILYSNYIRPNNNRKEQMSLSIQVCEYDAVQRYFCFSFPILTQSPRSRHDFSVVFFLLKQNLTLLT